jgi:RimJ/RimL family protein N-acetyltransferase
MSDDPATYRVMPRAVLSDGRRSLRAIAPGDIELVRRWRNDQLDILRQSRRISAEEQAAYFDRAIWPEKNTLLPETILLAYREDTQLIGYGGLVHIQWGDQRAEVSFLLDPYREMDPSLRAKDFGCFLEMVKQLAFNDLGLARLCTETYAMRSRHIEVLEAHGFIREGRLRRHVRVDGRPVDSLVHGCLVDDEPTDGAARPAR